MLSLSQSFRMGYGSIEHNLRICKGQSVRQNGIQERRHLNEHLVVDKTIDKGNYVDELIRKTIEAEIGEELNKLNEKHIKERHPGRVCTVEQWIQKQQYTRQGKQRKIVHEYIVQLGDKFSGTPYEIQIDKDGKMVDVYGNSFNEWDTRKTPAYKDGKITESKISKKLKRVYKEYLQEFKRKNPRARVICASIHCDEHGGCHMHINVIWFSKTKNGVGVGLAKTEAMKQQYESYGRKFTGTRTDNAQNAWRKEMKQLLKEVACRHNIEKKLMHNNEKHRSIDEFKDYKSEFCDALQEKERELQEKEVALSSDIAKQEWYILKKYYPDVYEKVHNDYKIFKKSVTKVLDTNTKVR